MKQSCRTTGRIQPRRVQGPQNPVHSALLAAAPGAQSRTESFTTGGMKSSVTGLVPPESLQTFLGHTVTVWSDVLVPLEIAIFVHLFQES